MREYIIKRPSPKVWEKLSTEEQERETLIWLITITLNKIPLRDLRFIHAYMRVRGADDK